MPCAERSGPRRAALAKHSALTPRPTGRRLWPRSCRPSRPSDHYGRLRHHVPTVGARSLAGRRPYSAKRWKHAGTIRRAKNDPFGDGRDGFVSAPAADALKAWLEATKISEGWLFRRVNPGWAGADALHPHSIGRMLKQRAAAAGLPVEITSRLSGHSMRVGAAQDMVVNGADILPIMRSGGWKSINVVARYVQNVELVKPASWRQ